MMTSQLDELRGKVGGLEVRNQMLEEKLATTLEKLSMSDRSLESSLASTSSLKKEQEDLLILLSDQDTKLEEYKTLLRGLGQEVSDDDVSDDGVDDGDDDDVKDNDVGNDDVIADEKQS
uniref:Uso1/p115-like vesicle tethering protein C-terminal domain-containing protein n=1 Tax=Ciona intestinalis TaxID=7719 RepID=F6WA29_CIOIN